MFKVQYRYIQYTRIESTKKGMWGKRDLLKKRKAVFPLPLFKWP